MGKCAIIAERGGSWVAVTAAAGTNGYAFSSSSMTYSEHDFAASLSAEFSAPLQFGNLDISRCCVQVCQAEHDQFVMVKDVQGDGSRRAEVVAVGVYCADQLRFEFDELLLLPAISHRC